MTTTPTSRRSRGLAFSEAAILGLGLLLGVSSACFTPPSDDVLFACEFDGDDKCPPDYACEADNCCHRVGSEVTPNAGNWGSCALGGNSDGGSSTGMDTTTETGSDGTDSGTQTGTETGTDTGTSTG